MVRTGGPPAHRVRGGPGDDPPGRAGLTRPPRHRQEGANAVIEPIDGAPEGVVAFRAVGEVHAEDYHEVLLPAVQAAIGEHGKVRLVFELGPEYEGYSAGAEWEDLKLGMGNLLSWERCAVVTDHDHLAHAVRAFGWIMPGQLKTF